MIALSSLTILAAPLSQSLLFPGDFLANENMWVFFLFIPIPLALIAFGIYLRSKHISFKKYMRVGYVLAVYLLAMGCFVFAPLVAPQRQTDFSRDYLSAVEGDFEISLPEPIFVNWIELSDTEQSFENGWIYSVVRAYYDTNDCAEVVKGLKNISLSEIPENLQTLEPPSFSPEDYDMVSIRNDTEETYNKPQTNKEICDYTAIFFSKDTAELMVISYSIDN